MATAPERRPLAHLAESEMIPRRSNRAALAAGLLLFAGTLALFAATRTAGFVSYDDGTYVAQNPHVLPGLSLAGVRWAVTSVGYACNWHPLTWISHMLDASLFRVEPAGHHLHSALLHAANAVLLWLVLRAGTGRPLASLAAAALFAVQPQRVESVAWISERKDLLAGFYGLAAIGFHILYVRRGRARYAFVCGLALALGLASKPTLVTLPFLLLLLDRWPLRRDASWGRLVREKLPLLALVGFAAALTLRAQSAGGCSAFAGPDLDLPARLANACIAYTHYLARAFWPTHLAVFYPHPALVGSDSSQLPTLLGSLLTLGLATALALWARRRVPALLVGWLWFLGMLVPMIGIVQVGAQAFADRYSYLPLIGIEVALVFGGAALLDARPRARPVAALGLTLACTALGLRTRAQIGVWHDTRTLFEHALEVTDRNYVAHINLGRLDGLSGRLPEARAHFEAAVRAYPHSYEAQVNLGWVLYLTGQRAAALEHLDRALARQPENADGHYKRARVLADEDRRRDALEELRTAVRLDPEHPQAAAFLKELVERGGD